MHIGLKSHIKKIFGVFPWFLDTKMTDYFAWDQKVHIPFYYNARIYTRRPIKWYLASCSSPRCFGGENVHLDVHVHTRMLTHTCMRTHACAQSATSLFWLLHFTWKHQQMHGSCCPAVSSHLWGKFVS